jgi:hypothetical protein
MQSTKRSPKSFTKVSGPRSLSLASVTLAVAAAVSCATPLDKAYAQPMRASTGGYELEVLVDGQPAPTYFHAGETYVMGQLGARYTLRVWNRTGRRIEAVVSVDGRDVIDGRPGDFRGKRGYLVPAWGSVDIDGWRLSQAQAAAFRFTSVPNSYAGRMGNARNVGVVGVAVFPERVYAPRPPAPIYPTTPPYYEPYASRDKSARGEAGGEEEARADGRGRSSSPSSSPSPSQAPAAEAAPPAGARGGAPADNDAVASAPARRAPSPHRPGLGTEFGESMTSHVREVYFVRANPTSPSLVLGLRYNDRAGLLALGIDVDGRYYGNHDDQYLRGTAQPFPVSTGRYARPPIGWQR